MTEYESLGKWYSIDVGTLVDYTAESVIELKRPKTPDTSVVREEGQVELTPQPELTPKRPIVTSGNDEYWLRCIHRLPLGLDYNQIAAILLTRYAQLKKTGPVEMVVDSTGIGKVLFDSLVASGAKPVGLTLTTGNVDLFDPRSGTRHLSKEKMILDAASLLGMGKLQYDKDMPLVDVLINELRNYTATASPSGKLTFGPLRSSQHDDVVISVAMGLHRAYKRGGSGGGRAIWPRGTTPGVSNRWSGLRSFAPPMTRLGGK
jgi:hypothetical protein